MRIKYSVIIPTLNEKYFIEKSINVIINKRNDVEIIVADGGSSDGTVEVAAAKGARVINTKKGRGIQLNAGASIAKGDILFFLHADTLVPENTFDLFDEFFSNENNNVCRFELGFDINNHLLKVYTFFSKFDTIFTRFGDSGIIVRKNFYKSLGGFKNYFVFEDVDFLQRASRKTKIKLLEAKVKSSARKFVRNGMIKNQIHSFVLIIKYLFGTNTFKLWNEYFGMSKKNKMPSLIIFARYPSKGKVKTRLAKDTSEDFALKFYGDCAGKILNQIKMLNHFNRYLFFTEAAEKEKVMNWAGSKFLYALQEGKNLGERMLNALELVFSHYAEKVIIVGTDVPDLDADSIKEAERKLDEADLVIGPSNDGGYYLLGMKKVYKDLFQEIEWSSGSVFNSTMKKAEELNLKTIRLEMLRDIDTKNDLDEWMNLPNANSLKRKIELFNHSKN